ncbi:hypothetical protein QP157_06925 [Sphingomonas sp. LR61]|uniref:hypothetical protein n=1 Tax=Sphingomonas sp. LR61 TaxID=3050234 RepID=UPI002FE3ADD0
MSAKSPPTTIARKLPSFVLSACTDSTSRRAADRDGPDLLAEEVRVGRLAPGVARAGGRVARSFEAFGHEGFEVLGRPETVTVPVVLHSGGHDDQPFVEMMRISDSSGSTRCARPHKRVGSIVTTGP